MKKANNKMNIGIYQPRLSYYSGGGEVIPAIHAMKLADRGHQVTVITTRASFIEESALFKQIVDHPSVRIKYIDLDNSYREIYDIAPGENWDRWNNESLRVGLKARETLLSSDFDIIATHNLIDSIAVPNNIPNLLHLHGYPLAFEYHHKLFSKIPDAFVAVSQRILEQWRQVIPKHSYQSISYNGIDCVDEPTPSNDKLAYELLYVGRLLPIKGIDTIIEALHRVNTPGVRLGIVGTGAYEKELKLLVNKYGLSDSVDFLGFVSEVKKNELYHNSKVVVLPSKSKEGILTTMLEAATFSKPIITTSNNSMVEFINHMENGILVQPESSKELAKGIDILLTQPSLAAAMGAKARERAINEWSWDDKIIELEDIYNDVIKEKKMSKVTMQWINSSAIKEEDENLPIKQVYVWYFTRDNKFILVSKDGEKWQFPGGKPDANESPEKTAVREVAEETAANIESISELRMFGYYKVTEGSESYLQLRYTYNSPQQSSDLSLSPEQEDSSQQAEDIIKHVNAVSVTEAKQLIPWLGESEELISVLATLEIDE